MGDELEIGVLRASGGWSVRVGGRLVECAGPEAVGEVVAGWASARAAGLHEGEAVSLTWGAGLAAELANLRARVEALEGGAGDPGVDVDVEVDAGVEAGVHVDAGAGDELAGWSGLAEAIEALERLERPWPGGGVAAVGAAIERAEAQGASVDEALRQLVVEAANNMLHGAMAPEVDVVEACRALLAEVGLELVYPFEGDEVRSARHEVVGVESAAHLEPQRVIRVMLPGFAEGGRVQTRAQVVISR